jgi:hypothetical protein
MRVLIVSILVFVLDSSNMKASVYSGGAPGARCDGFI